MSLYSWVCEHCGTLLDNTTTFHRCTNASRSTTDIDPGVVFEHFPPRDASADGDGVRVCPRLAVACAELTPSQRCTDCVELSTGVLASGEPTREQRLERALADMEARKDGAYEERNKVVAALAKVFPSGIARTAIEGWSEDWHGCVYIDMPTGQVSWHFHDSQAHLFAGLPPYTKPWDGHDTEEKYRRVAALGVARRENGSPKGGNSDGN